MEGSVACGAASHVPSCLHKLARDRLGNMGAATCMLM
jgi:hypothetical protein